MSNLTLLLIVSHILNFDRLIIKVKHLIRHRIVIIFLPGISKYSKLIWKKNI